MIAVARRLWLTSVGLALVVVCLAAGAAIRSAAEIPPPQHLQIALPAQGEGFSAAPHGALLDTERLAPGRSVRGLMGLRNRSGGPAQVSLTMVASKDINRCSAEKACAHSDARVSTLLRFTIETSTERNGRYATAWTGTSAQLAQTVHLSTALPTGAVRWVRLAARLSSGAGNAVQEHDLRFGLRVSLDGGVLGTSTTVLGGHHRHGIRIAGLAVTGARIAALIAFAAGLLIVGLLLIVIGRRSSSRGGWR